MEIIYREGILEKQIDQLIEYSKTDESVQRFTADAERFKDRKAFNDWKSKGRKIFTLSDEKDNLLGIIWIGQKEIEVGDKKYDKTFAIRIYGEARGKGLALDFMKKSVKEKGIWIECSADNLPAQALYKKFGFELVSKPDKNNKVILVY